MGRKTWFPLVFLMSLYMCEAARIMVVFPGPGKSHDILGMGIYRSLLDAGHEVTYLTTFPPEDHHKNLSIIDVSENKKHYDTLGMSKLLNMKAFMEDTLSVKNMLRNMYTYVTMAELTMKNQNVQSIFSDPRQHYDLVIIDWMFNEVYVGIPALFDCPYIWLSSVEPYSVVMRLMDETMNPAYTASSHSGNIAPFNFGQRLTELLGTAVMRIFKELFLGRREKMAYKEIFEPLMKKRGRMLPPYDVMLYNASLMFGNSHVSMGSAPRLPQSYKPIGGYHIDPNVPPLSMDLQKLMDNAKNGVIYFSMGSKLKSKDLPDQVKRDLLKVFGGLKQTVIWKFEVTLPNLPSNVHIIKWASQHSILNHPKCILFITHGGLLSITEAIHFGVPIIGIPVFSDQFVNVNNAVKKGFGRRVDFSLTMAEELKNAIEDVINKPEYRQKAKDVSLIYHDRPIPPSVELAHWVQHVIRTNGAPHLRSPALMVPWYQKLYLDLLAVVLTILFVVKNIIRFICCSKKKPNIADNSKKKIRI